MSNQIEPTKPLDECMDMFDVNRWLNAFIHAGTVDQGDVALALNKAFKLGVAAAEQSIRGGQ